MKKKQSIEQTYKKLSQVQHILLRPDTYIGSIQSTEQPMWILDNTANKFEHKKIRFIPGLYKIFDEILVNAADNYQRDSKMTKIEVNIDEKLGIVTVVNDGKSIPVQVHREHKIYVAELIFGHLLTSSNYEDKKKKVTGGRNGYGAKLTNIFSSYFAVETADSTNRKLLSIEWSKNMSKMTNPQISVYQGSDYTKITFKPDFQKFGIEGLSPEMIGLFKKRVYDMAGILKCNVFLNSQQVNVHSFHQYVRMYLKDPENQELIYDESQDSKRWRVVITKSEGQFSQISFVNSICTTNGGSHVNSICEQIVEKILPQLNKRVKDLTIKPFQIKSHFQIFLTCLIQNPSFTSQTKDSLTSNPTTFGSSYTISEKIIKEMTKAGINDCILNQLRIKQNNKIDKQLKKIKNSYMRLVIPKLEDANLAGKGNRCTLILTEGDSAKALAMCGVEKLGRDCYGVFPLRGKVVNVADMTIKQVMENFQISNIVKIIGLAFGKEYKNTNDLRYSSVLIMADQDTDGSHIKGLILNFFHTFWPSLCQIKGFLKQFVTPIIRCRRGNEKVDFFCQGDYETWRLDDRTDWKIKYYKGLGTSTSTEAQQYFSNLGKHQITFVCEDQKDKQCFQLAFAKKNADNRKKWLEEFDQLENVDYNKKELKIEDFFNKQFRHFSMYDNVRSIPSIMDGLKPSQRKILYACFKRNLKSQIKVAQLAGYVAQHSAYHHGQISLCSTIVSMSQKFLGSNNLNLLQPIGQFGTRHQNGKDHASARYIYTCLNPLTRYIYNQADDHIVQYQEQQNFMIQPKCYYPILPMVLINGCQGIGTGWSTNVHPHQVEDVLGAVRERIYGEYRFVNVGWEGFKGEVKLEKKGTYSIKGAYQVDGNTVTITQLPIGKTIREYKSFLQQKVRSLQNQDPDLQQIREYHNGDQVQFVITFIQGKQPDINDLEKYLKLQSKLQETNMILFNCQGKIHRYQTVADIVQEFYSERIKMYQKRRKYLISKYKRELEILEAKIMFINAVMIGKFRMMDTKQSWLRHLSIQKYKKFSEFTKIKSTKHQQPSQIQDNHNNNKDYNYLLTMPIWSFCQQKVVELQATHIEVKKLLTYYQNVKQQELWVKDLDLFQEAWRLYKEGKLQAKLGEKRNRHVMQDVNQGKNNRSRRNQIRNEDDVEGSKPTKRVKTEKKNLIQQDLENDEVFNQLNARKSGKEDWYRYEPIKDSSQENQKEEDKINSLLSKYLVADQNGKSANNFADRIKARVLEIQQARSEPKQDLEQVPEQQDNQNGNEPQNQENARIGNEPQNEESERNGNLRTFEDDLDWLE